MTLSEIKKLVAQDITVAITYARVSSKKQELEGHGSTGQEMRCRTYAEMMEYKVIASFQDEGISGAVMKRDGIDALLHFLKSLPKEAKVVVVIDELSRLARDVRVYWDLKDAIKDRNARLESPTYNFIEGPDGEFMETINAAQAAWERQKNKLRVINNMRSRLEDGFWPFPDVPPGYAMTEQKVGSRKNKVVVPDSKLGDIYKEALNSFATGRFSNQAAVRNFLEQKLGRKITIQSARNLLDRAWFYAGFIEYPKWNVSRRTAQHKALITIETMLQADERLNGTVKKHMRRDENEDFPLRGRVACAECDKRLRAAWCKGRSKKYPKYWCSNKACSLYAITVKKKDIEGNFEILLQSIKPDPRTIEATKRRMLRKWNMRLADVNEIHQSMKQQITTITNEVSGLAARIGTVKSPTVSQALERRVEELELKRLSLEQKITNYEPDQFDYRTALDEVVKVVKNPHKRWVDGELRERHQVLDICFLQDVSYHPKEGYRTAQLSPTFSYLTQYNEVSEGASEARLQRCGHGRN